jgi:nitroreductase
MKRVVFETLKKISGFDVDIRSVHQKSSNISLMNLNKGESVDFDECDFNIHIMVMSGEVEMISGEIQDVFKAECLASILPGQKVHIAAKEKSRVVIVRDDPLWVLRERRSVRKFAKIPIPKEVILKILDFSRLSPSGGNVQPWRLYMTSDEEKKKELAKASYGQDHVAEAPWVVVISAVPEESEMEYGERGKSLYSIQDTAALATYIMLTAKAYNLDTCWVGAFDEEEVRKIVGIPENERPVVIIPIGYGEEAPDVPERKPLSSILKEF